MVKFKPMLAGKAELDMLRYPVLASPKLDGVRCLAMNGKPMSRSMKVLPNNHVQKVFAEHGDMLEGLDGELIVGSPVAPDVYRQTSSAIMSEDGEPAFGFHVFDLWNSDARYLKRLDEVRSKWAESQHAWLTLLPTTHIESREALDAYEQIAVRLGYEGVMLRDPYGPYKQGRSSAREGYLLKVKRHESAEAYVVGFEERMHNANEPFKNELGHTKRSTAMNGLVPTDSLGALVVRGIEGSAFEGVEFNIGTGFDEADRQALWKSREQLLGQIVTFSYFGVGVKDAPRHPVFKGFRQKIDL